MKNIYTVLILLGASVHSLFAQITVTQNDFANSGNMVMMSVAVSDQLLDYKTSGPNFTWDFSNLQWQSQQVDTFLNPTNTGTLYAITFSNLSINPYRSNIARLADNPLTTLPLLSSIFTEGHNFYYKSSSSYQQKGVGMKISGFATPIPMTHNDVIYNFPMNYGNEDSSFSDYSVNVPQLGAYVHKQQRYNTVDGWGSLTIPFGTFDVLRVKTEITGSDSLYIDTLHFGLKVNADKLHEYKWIGNGQKEPLLQINTQSGILGLFPNFEFITKIVYRDSLHIIPTGIFDAPKDQVAFQVYPNPSSGSFFVSAPVDANTARIQIMDVSGKLMLSREMNSLVEMVNTEEWAKGIYILTLQTDKGTASKKLVVE